MLAKVSGLAISLAIVLAVVAGVVAIPGLNVTLLILVLGIVGGISAPQDGAIRMFLAVLALPVIGAALGGIPMAGEYLTAIFNNITAAAAGASATLVARRIYDMVMDGVRGFSS